MRRPVATFVLTMNVASVTVMNRRSSAVGLPTWYVSHASAEVHGTFARAAILEHAQALVARVEPVHHVVLLNVVAANLVQAVGSASAKTVPGTLLSILRSYRVPARFVMPSRTEKSTLLASDTWLGNREDGAAG